MSEQNRPDRKPAREDEKPELTLDKEMVKDLEPRGDDEQAQGGVAGTMGGSSMGSFSFVKQP